MIISASRRTDLPAFYAKWFYHRVRAGMCRVQNPMNPKQISRISLKPPDVTAVIFWTRYPAPLLPYLSALSERGISYGFLFTVVDYPRRLEPRTPPLHARIRVFRRLSAKIGGHRIIWRYDPIYFSPATGVAYHKQRFAHIARSLRGATHRCIISTVDIYRKNRGRLTDPGELTWCPPDPCDAAFADLMGYMAETAGENGMEIVSCAEKIDLRPYGIHPGKCIDDRWISDFTGKPVTAETDPSQRSACNCVTSRDIGAYNTCPFGCRYCYAVSGDEIARRVRKQHDPTAPALGTPGMN
jgi:hypothetical protein